MRHLAPRGERQLGQQQPASSARCLGGAAAAAQHSSLGKGRDRSVPATRGGTGGETRVVAQGGGGGRLLQLPLQRRRHRGGERRATRPHESSGRARLLLRSLGSSGGGSPAQASGVPGCSECGARLHLLLGVRVLGGRPRAKRLAALLARPRRRARGRALFLHWHRARECRGELVEPLGVPRRRIHRRRRARRPLGGLLWRRLRRTRSSRSIVCCRDVAGRIHAALGFWGEASCIV